MASITAPTGTGATPTGSTERSSDNTYDIALQNTVEAVQ